MGFSLLLSFPWNKGTRLRQPKMFSCAFEGSSFNPFLLSFSPKTAKELISLGNCQTQDLGRRERCLVGVGGVGGWGGAILILASIQAAQLEA